MVKKLVSGKGRWSLLAAAGLLALVSLVYGWRWRSTAESIPSEKPRLAVLLIFDQLRGDYLDRWNHLFGPGGFRRLENEGAWFTRCHYPYAFTVTACGHASILTGASPDRHGIIGNEWYDRVAREQVTSVGTDRYEQVPPRKKEGITDVLRDKLATALKGPSGVSPERLLVPTIGDILKEATGGKGRVVSLSLKDRSAVLPAGRHPDACYWADPLTGDFVTSNYYRGSLHSWVVGFNSRRYCDRWWGKDWTTSAPSLEQEQAMKPDYLGQDDLLSGRDFCHPLSDGSGGPNAVYYQKLATSPYGNDFLWELAKQAIVGEELGRDDVPDLLCISFSSNDLVGHLFGPDSHEVLDITTKSDRLVQDILDYLDKRVGKDKYLLALTADHGVCPLPERVRTQPAGRVPPSQLLQDAEAFLGQTFSKEEEKGRWIENFSPPWFYLDRDLIHQHRLEPSQVEDSLAGWLRNQPGIQATFTRSQLGKASASPDRLEERVRKSFHADRCGDVMAVLQPYHLLGVPLGKGTTHGTPHPYDTHVPLLVYGSDIPSGTFAEEVTPQTIAALFALKLGLIHPALSDPGVPISLLQWR